jgi:hypothetical protein
MALKHGQGQRSDYDEAALGAKICRATYGYLIFDFCRVVLSQVACSSC